MCDDLLIERSHCHHVSEVHACELGDQGLPLMLRRVLHRNLNFLLSFLFGIQYALNLFLLLLVDTEETSTIQIDTHH